MSYLVDVLLEKEAYIFYLNKPNPNMIEATLSNNEEGIFMLNSNFDKDTEKRIKGYLDAHKNHYIFHSKRIGNRNYIGFRKQKEKN